MKAIKCLACGKDRCGPIVNTSIVCRNCRCFANRLIENGFSANDTFILMTIHKRMYNHGVDIK